MRGLDAKDAMANVLAFRYPADEWWSQTFGVFQAYRLDRRTSLVQATSRWLTARRLVMHMMELME